MPEILILSDGRDSPIKVILIGNPSVGVLPALIEICKHQNIELIIRVNKPTEEKESIPILNIPDLEMPVTKQFQRIRFIKNL